MFLFLTNSNFLFKNIFRLDSVRLNFGNLGNARERMKWEVWEEATWLTNFAILEPQTRSVLCFIETLIGGFCVSQMMKCSVGLDGLDRQKKSSLDFCSIFYHYRLFVKCFTSSDLWQPYIWSHAQIFGKKGTTAWSTYSLKTCIKYPFQTDKVSNLPVPFVPSLFLLNIYGIWSTKFQMLRYIFCLFYHFLTQFFFPENV